MLVPNKVRKGVVFLGTGEGDRFKPRATGFIVSVKHSGRFFWHVVTAQHCIGKLYDKGNDIIWGRLNLVAGGVEDFPIPYKTWFHHPDGVEAIDVAVVPIQLDRKTNIFAHNEIEGIATDAAIKKHSIGVGDEVFICGLFANHYGKTRNIPIVRVGNIAAMPEEPVWTKYGYIEAYLIEAMSIGGLSGSPVYVHLPPIRVVDGKASKNYGPQYLLLGLMHGHFDVRNLNDDVVQDDAPGSINTGIGIVVPASKIKETIMQPDLCQMRDEIIERLKQKSGATMDAADGSLEPPTTEENPDHQEDFNRLLHAAVPANKSDR